MTVVQDSVKALSERISPLQAPSIVPAECFAMLSIVCECVMIDYILFEFLGVGDV